MNPRLLSHEVEFTQLRNYLYFNMLNMSRMSDEPVSHRVIRLLYTTISYGYNKARSTVTPWIRTDFDTQNDIFSRCCLFDGNRNCSCEFLWNSATRKSDVVFFWWMLCTAEWIFAWQSLVCLTHNMGQILYAFAKSIVVFTRSHRPEEAGPYFCEPGLKAHKFHYFHLICSVTNPVRSLYP